MSDISLLHVMNPKITIFFILILLSFSCKKDEKILSNSEKVVDGLQKEFGKFDAVEYYNDSTGIMYTYRPELNRTKKVKGVIDKTLNLVGTEHISRRQLDHEFKFGSYNWETPTEKISMRGALVYKDSSSYLNIWIETK